MKYAIIKVVNGNYFIEAEGFTEVTSAIIRFHSVCQALWNEPEVITGCVMIVDENLNQFAEYKELIRHGENDAESEE